MFEQILRALLETDIDRKLRCCEALWIAWRPSDVQAEPITAVKSEWTAPGRPDAPKLVPPQQLRQRKLSTLEGRAALIHAIAHIEFNAINLALDAAWRFRGMPADYYRDWLRVAREESHHFSLLRAHLRSLGYDYGAFPAHDGLWEMALKTREDVLVRMALVPRILEARGLDVTPGIQEKLHQAGDETACDILDIILRDEVGHVAIGNRWYHHCCRQRGVEPLETFRRLLKEYDAPAFRPPFHWQARRQGGFSELDEQLIKELSESRNGI